MHGSSPGLRVAEGTVAQKSSALRGAGLRGSDLSNRRWGGRSRCWPMLPIQPAPAIARAGSTRRFTVSPIERAHTMTTFLAPATIFSSMMTSLPGMGSAKKCPIRRVDERGSQDGRNGANLVPISRR